MTCSLARYSSKLNAKRATISPLATRSLPVFHCHSIRMTIHRRKHISKWFTYMMGKQVSTIYCWGQVATRFSSLRKESRLWLRRNGRWLSQGAELSFWQSLDKDTHWSNSLRRQAWRLTLRLGRCLLRMHMRSKRKALRSYRPSILFIWLTTCRPQGYATLAKTKQLNK